MPRQTCQAYTRWGRHAFTAEVNAESAFEAALLALHSFSQCGRPLNDRTGTVELTLPEGRRVSVRVPTAFKWLGRQGRTPAEQARKKRLKIMLVNGR